MQISKTTGCETGERNISSVFEQAFGLHATPLKEALATTIRWYQIRRTCIPSSGNRGKEVEQT